MSKEKEGSCTICEKWFPLLHWHHTIPQALGGKDSKQIPLCAQCHNVLHANAEAIVARRRNGSAKSKNFWASSLEETNAAPWLEILVTAILGGNDVAGKQYVMQFKATPALHNALQLYKMDSSTGSLEKAIILALGELLRSKGYLENEHSAKHKRKGKSGAAKDVTDLW